MSCCDLQGTTPLELEAMAAEADPEQIFVIHRGDMKERDQDLESRECWCKPFLVPAAELTAEWFDRISQSEEPN